MGCRVRTTIRVDSISNVCSAQADAEWVFPPVTEETRSLCHHVNTRRQGCRAGLGVIPNHTG